MLLLLDLTRQQGLLEECKLAKNIIKLINKSSPNYESKKGEETVLSGVMQVAELLQIEHPAAQ